MNEINSIKVYGLTIPLNKSEISPVIWDALNQGHYETQESKICPQIAQPYDRILELGSGIGIVSSHLAKVQGVTIKAFDANPENIPLAKRIAEANNAYNIEFNHGLFTSGPPQTFNFYIRKDLWMSSLFINQGPFTHIIEVKSYNIDEYLQNNPTDMLIMDIEGGELDILTNATLPGIQRIVVEVHDHLYPLSDLSRIFTALIQRGFLYEPRGSNGPILAFTRNNSPRSFYGDCK